MFGTRRGVKAQRMTDERIVAAILAGGASSRFGAPKALAEFVGAPLIAHVAQAMAGAAVIAVVGDQSAAEAIGAPRLLDPPGAARGPLAGVLAGLEWAAAEDAGWLAIAPCDAPLLPRDLVARLRLAAADGALACAHTDAGIEPLISLWRTSLLAEVRRALGGGVHPPAHQLMAQFGAVRVTLSATEAMNVNTPADFARAERAYAARA